jgi:flagellar motility protein MotE (MotC chaperone)
MEAQTSSFTKKDWIVYVVLLPLVFTSIFSGVILQLLGFNLVDKAESAWTQVKSAFHAGVAAAGNSAGSAQPDKSAAQIAQLNRLVAQLRSDLDQQKQEADQWKQQAEDLQRQLSALQTANQSYEEQAKVYTAMTPDSAAAILSQLPESQVANILAHIDVDSRAAILSKMDPKEAAKVISMSP